MKNKREKKKISSSGKALVVFLCFVLTIFFIALKGFSHSSEEDSRFRIPELNTPEVGVKSLGHTERLGNVGKHQSANGRSKTNSGGYLTEVGVWGYGPCHASFVNNDRLYMGTGRKMVIFDISTPSSPVKLGDVTLSSMVNSIYVDGNYAYTAVSFGGFQVVDISNPGVPVVIGSFDTSGNSKDIYIDGSHAYVADYDRGLRIVDISNPSSPIEIGFFQTSGYAYGVHVLGNFAYVANWSNGLRIIDISNPTAPFETGYYDTEDWALGVYVSGSYAYVADNNSGLRIIDVSVPQSPVEVGYYYDYYHDAKDVYVSGIYAYTAGGYDGMRIIDVSNPTAPSLISHLDTPETALSLSISGNYSYLTNGYSGLFVIDISTISSPIEVAHIEAAGRSFSVFVSDSYAYIANEKQGLRIIDISNLSLPTEMAYLDTNYALDVYVSGSYAYVADNWDGMRIFDVSNPSAPIETGFFLAYASGVFVSDNLAYIADYNSGLIIIDIANPNSPTEVGSCVWPQPDSEKVYVSGNYAYVADGDNGIKVINISNPTAPFRVGELNTAGFAQDIHVLGSYAYVADSWNGLRIIYVENPGNPVEVGFYDTPDFAAMGVYVVGSHAFVTAASYGLYVIDVSDPMSPLEVDSYLALHYAKDVFVDGGYAYVADSEGGMPIIDVKNYIPSINIISPNGGESWEVNSEREIKWISYVISGNVSIDYTYDGGLNWIEITDSTENDGSFIWAIPQNVSVNCMVRISNSTGTISHISDAVFTILEPKAITVTVPNGGENWEGTTSQDITWTGTGGITNVMIEYSTNNGSSWNTIIASTANNGTYNWTVPNTPSTSCLVKVSDTTGPAVDTSDAVFTIAAQRTLTVTSPNGGENWEGTTSQNITWTGTGTIANVMIEYSTNNGSSWNTIMASTANNGTYNWTVPNTPSTSCLVKISDTAGPAADTSDAVFTIAAQRTITVIAPNGGENWEGTTSQNITWTGTGGITNVMIEYSTNNGSSWNTITASTANSGTYNWTVPNTPSTSCLVKVSDTAGPASDTGNGVFTIAELRTVSITSPTGNERWFIDSTYPITWVTTGSITNVMIEYSTNNGSSWDTVVSSIGNSGIYNWTIPNTPSNNCLVRVSDTAGPASDVCNGVFTIDPYPTITVAAPNSGETWEAYTLQTISWSSTGTVTDVNIDYSTNGGSSWNTITSSILNTGSFNWTIPYIESNNCLVRVSDLATAASDTSDGVFTMVLPPSIIVTSPNGGESWARRSTQTITWTGTGNVGDVDIRYSKDGGSSWELIASSTPNSGSFQWSLPNVNKTKTQCLVRITAVNGSAEDTSDAFFTILK